MKEVREIIEAYKACQRQNTRAVLATVVHLEGSSYRRPGARMMVDAQGMITGAISGGCLEGDALNKALYALSEKRSRLVTYDTSDEEDVQVGLQLGCEGIVQVLFEYIDAANPYNAISLLERAISRRQHAALITLFDLSDRMQHQPGTCLLLEEDGTVSGEAPVSAFREQLLQDADHVIREQRSAFRHYSSDAHSLHAFIEYLEPPVSLVIVGAGNDAIPVMRFAEWLGWETRVVDGRSTHASKERFASACQILVSKPESVLEQIPMDMRTAFVLMTHNYKYDLQMLSALAVREIPYIGVLGPQKKLKRMLDEMKENGLVLSEQQLSKIYGPTGLDIAAETPEEIALSIIAEVQAVMKGRSGQMLKFKTEFLHERTGLQFTHHQVNLP